MDTIRVTNIPYQQVKYLKHMAKLQDVKLTVCIRHGFVCLHIQDKEHLSFEAALRHLQEDARNIAHTSQDMEVL